MKDRISTTTALMMAALLALTLAGCGKDREKVLRERTLASETISSIGVNAYLWRAALNTLDFLPMAQVDSAGGVIISDWYVNPADPQERAKVTVYIVDKSLRADAVKVNVFKQVLKNGEWADSAGGLDSEKTIADAILIEARRLRLAQVSKED